MVEISAADQHVIRTKDGKWRLAYQDTPLAEGSDKGFRYGSRFGRTRRLPDGGLLTQDNIQQIVLGWQVTDESWHLGLLLAPDLVEERGSRWVEIVHWPDPEITVFQDLAQESGQQLAQAIGIPFYVIPPQDAVEPATQVRELPQLPLRAGHWQMEALDANQGHFIIRRTSSWFRERVSKMAWYGFWSIVYLVISVATIFGDIALPVTGTLLPNPQILPYIGLVISAGLVVAVIIQVGLISFSIDRIVIDGPRGAISAWNRKRMRWMRQQADIQSVYVSEQIKKRANAPGTEYGELNLHLGGGEFQFLLNHEEPDDNTRTPQPKSTITRTEGVYLLNRAIVHTDLQAMALYIAEALSTKPSVWLDLRVK